MNALGLLTRRSLRAHARAAVGLALVVAIAGGLSLTTFAAARRTGSSFTRFLAANDVSDLSIAVTPRAEDQDSLIPQDDGGTPTEFLALTDPILEAGAELPGVARTSSHIGLDSAVYLADAEGRARPDSQNIVGSLDGRFTDTDRIVVREGRRPRPDRPDEVLVNQENVDRFGLALGSEHELVAIGGDDVGFDVASAPILDSVRVTVVGIGRWPQDVLRDEFDVTGQMLVTPALTRSFLEVVFAYRFHALHLTPGTDPSTVVNDYLALGGDDVDAVVRRTDEQRDGAQLALRPIVVALAVFGVLAAFAAFSLGFLGAARISAAGAADLPMLRATGLSRAATVLTVATPAVVGVVAGAIGAVVLAVAMSPVAPVGPIREVEPDRGIDVDAVVLVGGVAVLLAVLVSVTLAGATLVVRRAVRADRRPTSTRSAPLATLSALALPPAASVGVREGLGTGSAGAGAAIRSTLASCTVSVIALVATLTFGASIDGLVGSPDRYGWAADRAFLAGFGYVAIPPEAAEAVNARPDVRSAALASFGPVELGGRSVSSIGLDGQTGDAAVTLLSGRLPADDREVALGVSTARDLGVGIDDTVEGPPDTMTVVGLVAMPAIGPLETSHPTMSLGAVLTPDALLARNRTAIPVVAFVDFAEGADVTEATAGAHEALASTTQVTPEAIEVLDAQRPAVLAEVDAAKATAFGLAGVLGVVAIVALALTLSASVRRRRAQLALLASLGFDRRDLRRSVRWQTGCMVGVSLVLGVPLGVVAGRLAWMAFADEIGVTPAPEVPLTGLAVAVVAIMALAVVIGERPARTAARTPPAAALRPLA